MSSGPRIDLSEYERRVRAFMANVTAAFAQSEQDPVRVCTCARLDRSCTVHHPRQQPAWEDEPRSMARVAAIHDTLGFEDDESTAAVLADELASRLVLCSDGRCHYCRERVGGHLPGCLWARADRWKRARAGGR